MDIPLGSHRENQKMFMDRATAVLHGTVFWYLDHKVYLYTGTDVKGHLPELPFYALAKAQDYIETKYNIKIKRIYRRTDKESSNTTR